MLPAATGFMQGCFQAISCFGFECYTRLAYSPSRVKGGVHRLPVSWGPGSTQASLQLQHKLSSIAGLSVAPMAPAAACLVVALLAGVLPFAVAAVTAAAPAPALAAAPLPVVQFPAGARLQDLPGAAALHPMGLVTDIKISMIPAVVEGFTGSNGDMTLRFTNPLYRDDSTGNTFLFGEKCITNSAGQLASVAGGWWPACRPSGLPTLWPTTNEHHQPALSFPPMQAHGSAVPNFRFSPAAACRGLPACLCPPAGPTLRARAGTSMSMHLTNELVQPGGHSEGGAGHNHAAMKGFHGELGRCRKKGGHGASMQCSQHCRRRHRLWLPAAGTTAPHNCSPHNHTPRLLLACSLQGPWTPTCTPTVRQQQELQGFDRARAQCWFSYAAAAAASLRLLYPSATPAGLHDATGVPEQVYPPVYLGGDNVFITIPGKPNVTAPAAVLLEVTEIPEDHMPGAVAQVNGLAGWWGHRGKGACQGCRRQQQPVREQLPSWGHQQGMQQPLLQLQHPNATLISLFIAPPFLQGCTG